MLFNLRLASSSMHLVSRNLNWKYAIKANGLQSTRNYLTQNQQIDGNFIRRQLKNVNQSFHRIYLNGIDFYANSCFSLLQPTHFCRTNRTWLVQRQYSNAVGGGSSNGKTTDSSRKLVGYWLLGCGGLVFVAVALGGIVYYSICNVLKVGLEKPSRK